MAPLLSILIPTKNREAYLPHALTSALSVNGVDIEIVCSENHGSDNAYDYLKTVKDDRLKVIRPDKPIAMHENFEYLLSHSKGKWVTFIGDDDAILPSSIDYLRIIDQEFKYIEALYSARSYFYWPQDNENPGTLRAYFSSEHKIRESKTMLNQILKGQTEYCYAPQIYSGGFQKRSLIKRVINAKGRYFYTITPDANSALNALLMTTDYLQIGIPLTIVGTSPYLRPKANDRLVKDREKDFLGALGDSFVELHPLVFNPAEAGFPLWFLETYLNSAPLVSPSEFDKSKLAPIIYRTIQDLLLNNKREHAIELCRHLNFSFPADAELSRYKEVYPRLVPDPTPQSVVLQSSGEHNIFTISQAVEIINQFLHHISPLDKFESKLANIRSIISC